MHIHIVVNNECMSMGDALRDIDSRSIIHGDFFLVCGDIVSNMNLTESLQAHKRRRQVDRNYIMTMVLKETSPFHRSRERCESGIFAIDSSTGECIAYEPVESESMQTVLALYTENFDYQDIRKDFLRGVLTSDILGVKVATHILTQEYAGRVRSPHLYDSISKDIIERWVFPIVPEADLLEEQPYVYRRGNKYLGPDVVLSRSAKIGSNVVLGSSVSVGENSVITDSVIGARCSIGADVTIENCYIWEGTVIENGCSLSNSIIADHVVIKAHSTISRGCLITSNITIGPSVELPPDTRVAKLGEHVDLAMRQLGLGDSDDIISSFTVKQKFLGESSDGVVWEGTIDEGGDDDELEDPLVLEERLEAYKIGGDINTRRPIYQDIFSDDDNDDSDDGSVASSNRSGEEADLIGSNTFGRNSAKFFKEGSDLMKHAIETNYVMDNAMLEINGLKFACNATFSECRQVVLNALFIFIDQESMAKSIDRLFSKWAPLLNRFTQGIEEQVDLITAVQTTCENHPGLERSFQFIIPMLYKTDVLDDDSILDWFSRHQSSNSLYIRQWLQNDGEEEESEQEESDDDGEQESSYDECDSNGSGYFNDS